MKAVIQRVAVARVTVDGLIVGAIDQGLLVFLGITHTDSEAECDWLCEKIAHLRIFSDTQDKMNLSVVDIAGQVLVVSQFTLYANAMNGRRPDFIQAARPEVAMPLYEKFVAKMEKILNRKVATGIFGAKMSIELINDGPVTIVIDTDKNI